ncbi:unnamed protein product [Euphydryas editha]|uniref:Uncharacterized protein n=1 Tax=Euphydryas editha TaxID=104508 RepID=A0AAU9TQS2_EUPED|nr:unnamed protein product [Euphydryas editha]
MVSNIVDGRLVALQLLTAPPCRPPLAGDSASLAQATRGALAERGKGVAASSASEVAQVGLEEFPALTHASNEGKRKGKGKGKWKNMEWTRSAPPPQRKRAPREGGRGGQNPDGAIGKLDGSRPPQNGGEITDGFSAAGQEPGDQKTSGFSATGQERGPGA